MSFASALLIFNNENDSNGFTYLVFSAFSIGHEYPYSIKMKHLKATSMHNHSFDQIDDQHSQSLNSIQHQSSSSLNSFNVSQSHDFELRQRDFGHSTGRSNLKVKCFQWVLRSFLKIIQQKNIDFFINVEQNYRKISPMKLKIWKNLRRIFSVKHLMNFFINTMKNFHLWLW